MSYTDVHRMFLQACTNHGTLSKEQAYELLIGIHAQCGDSDTIPKEDEVAEVVAAINNRIYRFDQKIVYTHYDPTEGDFYVFVNLIDSPINRHQNMYTAPELQYFRALLREITLTDDHQLPLIACLNLTNQSADEGTKPVAKARAEQLLAEWEQSGYFLILDNQCYFGPRTIVEFENYLNTNFADLVTRCCLCNVTIFYGLRCAKCPQILHRECMKKYLRRLTNCPACKELWTVKL
ncbi:non-structural maintenance of chromosomes element 1 homolog [Anopheles albimanus]|uniref:Non-structural maintenance of chromosomes element 1 homolog n=1 Tax=Anopheles albimanus TaxID=7167 RepID=A0A182FFD2_ANOAL|nr:non-structural maintenance of chromosomes element 1 homolog [Anopheles albimanus]